MHRTKDIGRWRIDGSLLIEGRISGDTQIKLRGIRMDLREIEKSIIDTADGMLSEAVVSVHSTNESSDFLVARVLFTEHDFNEKERAQCLKKLKSQLQLPQNMRPAIILAVEKFPMTNSSKIDRKAIASWPILEEGRHNTTLCGEINEDINIILTDKETQLKAIWSGILPTATFSMRDLTSHTDFFHVGGTSMLLLELQAQIRTTFSVEIPLVHMFESSTLDEMARLIENSTAEASESLLNWDKETALPPSLKKLAVSDIQIAQPTESDKVIVLTGASGFLGQALLASLDSDTRVKNIHCIAVRKAISQESISRFAKAVIHQGDLNLPRLGLSEHSAQAIFSCATVVIHNGADVSYLKGYSSLRIANLQSTKELAALCLPRLIPFHYVSTAGVAMFATGALGPDNQSATASAAFYPPPLNLSLSESGHNYIAMTASKWASEQFLERMVMEKFPAWPICIHRPSLIERKDESGAGLDIVSNLRYYTQQLHAAPVINIGISGTRSLGKLNQVPLSTVVRGILQAALDEPNIEGFSSASKTRFLHHLGDVSLPLGDIRSWVAQDGDRGTAVMIEELPIDEWTRKAGECGMNKMVITLLESLIGGTDVVFPEYD